MKNREKFAEEIVDIACDGEKIAIKKDTGKLCACTSICCDECGFDTDGCRESRKKWANAEYVEKPKISKWDKGYLLYLKPEWKYIARNKYGSLRAFCVKADKEEETWSTGSAFGAYNLTYGHDLEFPMVKWEDEEPWRIEDLKKLEVVEEYENN